MTPTLPTDGVSGHAGVVQASAAASALVTLLRDQGQLCEALTLIDQKIEFTRQAGLGAWTQLSNQGRRLQILSFQGRHEQVLTDLPALRHCMTEIPDQCADNDIVDPWNVQEIIFGTGHRSAVALGRWEQALDLINQMLVAKRRRGASPHEMAHTRFKDYGPLLRLGRLTETEQLLDECQDVFDTARDITMLTLVYGARAELEDIKGHRQDAVDLQRTALRLGYTRPVPHGISVSHYNLANYLSRSRTNAREQRAHRLAAALLYHLIGDTHALTQALHELSADLRDDTDRPEAAPLPTTLPEVIRLVDAGEGVHFGQLVASTARARSLVSGVGDGVGCGLGGLGFGVGGARWTSAGRG